MSDAAGSIAAVRLHPQADGSYRLDLPDASHRVEAEEGGGIMRLRLDGVVHRMTVVRDDDALTVISNGANHALRVIDPLAPPRQDATGSDRVTAPIPARVVRVLVEPGETVARGTPLIVLEAMKMELVLSAPTDGTVESIRHAVDEMVDEGTELVTFASD